MALTYFRALTGAIIALIIAIWFYDTAGARQIVLPAAGVLFLFLLVLQSVLSYSHMSLRNQYLVGYGGDALIAGLLIFATGGVGSPFAFISGLIVVASGLHAMRLLPQLVAVFTCITYLGAAYGDEWIAYHSPLDFQQALNALLQVSALLLVGGVMAYISRRHALLRDSSDRVHRQHRQLKDLYDHVMSSMHEGVVVLDEDLRLSDSNDAATILLGSLQLEELLEKPDLKGYLEKPSATSFQCDYPFHHRVLLVRVSRLSPDQDAAWLLTLVDISEIRKLEEELIQQEKMAALGQMAAMLAHEIRNPIQTMTQGLEFIGGDSKNDSNIKHIMHDEMLRLNRLVSTMLDYSKPMKPEVKEVAVGELISSSIKQSDMSGSEKVVWHSDDGTLLLDPDHFRLVLDNLISNALANSLGNGEVHVEMRVSEVTWNLEVSNPGEVSEELKEKLFDPFVSGRSRGVGLGLATVQLVCKANGWLIDLLTRDGETCFTVTGVLIHAENLRDGKEERGDG